MLILNYLYHVSAGRRTRHRAGFTLSGLSGLLGLLGLLGLFGGAGFAHIGVTLLGLLAHIGAETPCLAISISILRPQVGVDVAELMLERSVLFGL